MFGNLRKISDAELLNYVKLILNRPGIMTSYDYTELTQIDNEFRRRELLTGLLTESK